MLKNVGNIQYGLSCPIKVFLSSEKLLIYSNNFIVN